MNNEIKRKITSLTLMTIMLAGGMIVAVPSMVPAAHAANANLFVSAENTQFSNYMSGPQVIEVVVIDSNLNSTTEGEGEPDVTVNGKKLRMVQATDGNWYGYFADKKMALIADSTAPLEGTVAAGARGQGLDFGTFCTAASAGADNAIGGGAAILFTETVGVAVPHSKGADGTVTGADITANCDVAGGQALLMNVVREAKTPTVIVGNVLRGQINIDAAFWPFVQLYNLNPTGNVVVTYNKGGGAQTATLTFDTVSPFAKTSLDRVKYTTTSQVHMAITDLWLNIDPTDEDSWTFGTRDVAATAVSEISTFYQVFNEDGAAPGDTAANIRTDTGSLTTQLRNLMCDENCVLEINPNVQGTGNVITLQDNDDSAIVVDAGDATQNPLNWETASGRLEGAVPVTITEQGTKSGVFSTYDESDVSDIIITDGALRGTSASVKYNGDAFTILVGFDFATIDIAPIDDEWNSGEDIPVVVVDGDANKNSRADEDMKISDTNIKIIPTLTTGNPFTLGTNTDYYFIDDYVTPAEIVGAAVNLADAQVVDTFVTTDTDIELQAFSKRAIINLDNTENIDLDSTATNDGAAVRGSVFVIDYTGQTLGDLKKTVRLPEATAANTDATSTFEGFNFFNYDITSFNKNILTVADGGDGSVIEQLDIYLVIDTDGVAANLDDARLTGAGANLCLVPIAVDQTKLVGLATLNDAFYNALYDDDACGATTTNADTNEIAVLFLLDTLDTGAINMSTKQQALVADFFSYGFTDDGVQANERVADQIIRLELEESGDNTSIYQGTLEFVMINQLNISQVGTFSGLKPISDDPTFVAIEDLTDEDSPRVSYNDLGADGIVTQISDQAAAPAHSGVVSFDSNSYKIADTVVITLEDADLNVDSDLIDIYTVVTDVGDVDNDVVGIDVPARLETLSFGSLGKLLEVTFDDIRWENKGANCNPANDGFASTRFTLVETDVKSGIFSGSFQIPLQWCRNNDANAAGLESTTGKDIEVNYVDYRDASGEIIEVGDGAGVRANTGSISLDRTVYPVPFGVVADFTTTATQVTPNGQSLFVLHESAFNAGNSVQTTTQGGRVLPNGDVTIHVRVNDPDSNTSATGEDKIQEAAPGPVKISVIRGADSVILGYAGGINTANNKIDAGAKVAGGAGIRQFGPMTEIAPDAGIFESDIVIRYTDGPNSTICPPTSDYDALGVADTADTDGINRFDVGAANDYCILQGDILQVEYTDPQDASGSANTVTDSATFDLRNGVLQTDKSVYIIGSDMILTIIDPDFDLDNDQAETYDLDLIEWDSDAATVTMGDVDGEGGKFDPEPTDFRETGDSTGIFQIVIEIPEILVNKNIARGEQVVLEYNDWGPSGAKFVGQEKEDVNLTIFTSNFGATVELDQKVYTWTDKVYITIVAPDHNFDSNLIDSIGETTKDPLKVSTRGFDINRYKLVETGTDTGIFTGEVILTGFAHDADGVAGNEQEGAQFDTSADGTGPTNGLLRTDDDDGITVSFEFSEDESVVGSALIRWNIGEVQWLEASYPASGTGVARIIDPDMNLNPEAVDNFKVDVWSDSDSGGIDLTVTETNEATGIFEGTVFFTVNDESSGHRLRVAEGDTVTAEYEDNTLPNPYTRADELEISATTLIGTIVPPLERAPAANLRTVDAFGNSLSTVSIDQQVQITADLANGQDREQAFAYLVQIQDGNGVTVSLAWITGSLSAGQSFSPALSWIPTEAGTYTATAFVWESVDNPTALSPPVSTEIIVQ